MIINELLNGKNNCSCGMEHTCDIQNVIIENGAVKHLGELTKNYNNVLLVADQNTYKIGGKDCEVILGSKVYKTLVFDSGSHFLVPNEQAIEKVSALLTEKTDLIIGVGSGVINDICKYVSFLNKLPYFIVATAPSMDGYASVGAAMIIDNMKITYDAHVPTAIIGDVDMLKTAPIDMIKSGFGDIIGKYSALNDWKISHVVKGEYFCKYVYELIYDMINQTIDIADGILNREDQSIKTLMEALVVVGIAMSYVGNSRPASGSEHHLSHYFEIVGLLNDEPYFNHGIDVAYSTVITQTMREEILSLDSFKQAMPFDYNEWSAHIKRSYSKAADGIIKLQDQLGWYQEDYMSLYNKKRDEIISILSEVPSAKEIEVILSKADLHMSEFYDLYSADKINDAKFIAKDLKNRYTVLWLYYILFYKN